MKLTHNLVHFSLQQGTPYDLKDNAEIWRNLSQSAACFPYDPTGFGAYGYG